MKRLKKKERKKMKKKLDLFSCTVWEETKNENLKKKKG